MDTTSTSASPPVAAPAAPPVLVPIADALPISRELSLLEFNRRVLALAEDPDVPLLERLRFLCRPQLLIIDEIGYLPVIAGGGNLVFQLVNARYERGAMILTSNRGFAEWGDIFGSPVVATALLDRLLHHAIVVQIEGASYRLRQHADLIPENLRVRPLAPPQPSSRRRGRPPKDRSSDLPAG